MQGILVRVFSMFSKTTDVHDLWAQGPWGPWDPDANIHVCDLLKIVLWSGTYLEVFLGYLGAQGTP